MFNICIANKCSCTLGYRNGTSSSDANLCMGPSEAGGIPCYPTPCNAGLTPCTTECDFNTRDIIFIIIIIILSIFIVIRERCPKMCEKRPLIELPNSIFEIPRVNTNFILDRSQSHNITVEAVPVKN